MQRKMMKIKDIFHPTLAEEYELAKAIGDKRFASPCKHEHVANGRCLTCLRRVISK